MLTAPTDAARGKVALVLAGGGVTGAAYELGVLHALDERLANRAVTDFDLYIGTSAGAILSALLANGISPADMHRLLHARHPSVRGLRRGDVFAYQARGLARWAAGLPSAVLAACAGALNDGGLSAFLFALAEAGPPGLYDGAALARYLREALLALGGSDRFDALARALYVIATDLGSGERAVFGPGYLTDAPISQAVAASTALPFFYWPVEIGGRAYVDGGIRGHGSLDVAVENGARLVICVNPLVPCGRGENGLPTGNPGLRALRISAHAGLHYHLKHLRQRYPDVDFVLVEPSPDDSDQLEANFMDFRLRHRLAERGYHTAGRHFAAEHARLAPIFARHGLALRPPEARRDGQPALAERPASRSASIHPRDNGHAAGDGHGRSRATPGARGPHTRARPRSERLSAAFQALQDLDDHLDSRG
jgi:predicted acylesterase/phospholipase RssA